MNYFIESFIQIHFFFQQWVPTVAPYTSRTHPRYVGSLHCARGRRRSGTCNEVGRRQPLLSFVSWVQNVPKKNREFNFKNSNIFKPTLRIQHGDTRKMSKKPRRSPKLPTFIENGYTSWNAKGKWRKKS